MPAEGPVPPLVAPYRADPHRPQPWPDSDRMSRVFPGDPTVGTFRMRPNPPVRERIEELVERGRLLQQAAICRGVRRLWRLVAAHWPEALLIAGGLAAFAGVAWVYAA